MASGAVTQHWLVQVIGQRTRVRRVAKRLLRGPLGRLGLRQGALTEHLVASYCSGFGMEIGAGGAPYTCRTRTVLVDHRPDWTGVRQEVDVLADGASLPVRDDALDYVLASHCLEHQADVITALQEWRRVLRVGGHLFLIMPHVDRTFDRGRPVHGSDHHWAERATDRRRILESHWDDFARVIPASNSAWTSDPRARRADGSWDRAWIADAGYVHYHAWNQDDLATLLRTVDLQLVVLLEVLPERPDSFLVICRVKSGDGGG